MIRGTSLSVHPIPNKEHMRIVGEAVKGSGERFVCHIYREELTPQEQTMYDNAVALVGANYYNTIENTQSELDIERITSSELSEGTDVKDFESFSELNKDKLRNFLDMVLSKIAE